MQQIFPCIIHYGILFSEILSRFLLPVFLISFLIDPKSFNQVSI